MIAATIMGSPKKKGNTATALALLERLLTDSGHKADRINVVDYARANEAEVTYRQEVHLRK